MLIWVTRQLYRLRLIDMNDVKAVVEGVVNDGVKKKFTDAGLCVFDYGGGRRAMKNDQTDKQ